MPITLYFTNSTCSTAAFLALKIAGIKFEAKAVTLDHSGAGAHKLSDGTLFKSVNPKGNVPAIVTEAGTLLNEGAAVHEYINFKNPAAGLYLGAYGSEDYFKAVAAFSFVGSDIHAGHIAKLFSALGHNPESKATIIKSLEGRFAACVEHFIPAGATSFFPGKLTSADLYLFWSLNCLQYLKVELNEHMKAIQAYIGSLPQVKDNWPTLEAAFAAGNTSQ